MSEVFTDEAVARFGENYEQRARPEHGASSRGGCMKAVYIGLGSLYGPRYDFRGGFHKEFFKDTRKNEKARGLPEGRLNTIDRVFRALEGEGVAGTEQKFKPAGDQWKLPDGTTVASLEEELTRQVSMLPDGSHFFGVAVDDAIHSLILRLHKSGHDVTVFWMDQFSDGFDAVRSGGFVGSPDVTGSLDDELRQIGNGWTSVWHLQPSMATGVSIEVDADGDGVFDFQAPAIHEVPDPDHSF